MRVLRGCVIRTPLKGHKMKHAFLDRFCHADTPLNVIDPRIKTLLTFAIVIYIVATPTGRYLDLLLVLPVLVAAWYFSRVPLKYLLKRLFSILIFITVISIGIVLTRADGVVMLLALLAKGVAAMWALTILTATTPFPALLKSLQSIKVPLIILNIMNFLYRYVFLLIDEYERLQLGRNARAFSDKTILKLKGIAWMVGMLFIRSFERADRVYHAMLSRGFDGHIVTNAQKPLNIKDMGIFIAALTFLIISKYIGIIYG